MNSPESNICESNRVRIEITPGSSEYYVPNCSHDLKPWFGQKFCSLEDAIQFYKCYAAECGFDIRRGPAKSASDGTIIRRYIYCNREGTKNAKSDNIEANSEVKKIKRRRVSNRVSCKARLVLKYGGCDGYIVDEFIERHTHTMVSMSFKPFMKVNRNLDFAHQNFILNCNRANIGPMKSYRLFKEVVGSYSSVGCTSLDFKNFSRDLRAYVNGVDAQLILDKLFNKREVCPAFTFDYCVDEHDKLTRLFWADPISRKNYFAFGEALSFDATYETNKYNLIFAPLTGKDQHGKCVTFGAGLLSREDVESYVWLFEKFKVCMASNPPTMIITDQDPAMKIAIERVFPESRHRLCMWHIMEKVSDKVPTELKKDESFLKRLNEVVWSEVYEPAVFERSWNELMNEFGLADNNWFNSMYDLRHHWIPAYFREVPMSGLFRTTSVSESVNSFFGKFSNSRDNLVGFFMHFDSALDAQRHTHTQNCAIDEAPVSQKNMKFLFEKHAATIYTAKIFKRVQKEIYSGCNNCSFVSMASGEVQSVFGVDDGFNPVFDVTHNKSDGTITCGCKKFITSGLLCRHVFAVLKNLKFETIPEIYIISRWTKYAYLRSAQVVDSQIDDLGARAEDNKLLMNEVHSEIFNCLGLIDGNSDRIKSFLRGLREVKELIRGDEENQCAETGHDKHKLFDRFYGSIPKDVTVLPPEPVKTKGSGSRLKSRREKAIERMNKPLRKCSKCKQMTNHDARNCPKVVEEKVVEQGVVEQGV